MTIEYKDSKRFSGLSDGVSSGYDVANISYSGKSSSSSSQNTYMLGIGFNADGTKMYRTGYSATRAIFQYTLSTAWDISTASYDSVSFSLPSPIAVPYGIEWNGDGTKFVVGDNSTGDLYQFSLTTAYDISTTNSTPTTYDPSETSKPVAFKFFNNGLNAFLVSQNTDYVLKYTLSTAYDISTMSYATNSLSYTGSYYISGMEINSDGTELYLMDHSGNSLRRYTLSTAYDLSTASLTSSFSTSSQFSANTASALRFSADGTKLYISGYGASDFQYDTVSTASDRTLLTNVQDNSIFVETDTARRYWSSGYFPSATVTRSDDFSSDGWTDNDSTYIGVSGGSMNWNCKRDGTNDASVYDLTSTSANWVLRFKLTVTNVSSSTQAGNGFYVGLSDSIQTAGQSTSQDFIGVSIYNDNTDTYHTIDADGSALPAIYQGDSSQATTYNTGSVWYYEIIKTGSSYTVEAFSGSDYSTGSEGKITGSSSATGLRYLKVLNDMASIPTSTNPFQGTINTLKFYDGVTNVGSPATWTRGYFNPTDTTLFSTSTGWTGDTSVITNSGDTIVWDTSVLGEAVVKTITTLPTSGEWVMRFKVTRVSGDLNDGSFLTLGSSSASTSTLARMQNGNGLYPYGIHVAYFANGNKVYIGGSHNTSFAWDSSSTTSVDWSVGDSKWIEVSHASATAFTTKIYSNANFTGTADLTNVASTSGQTLDYDEFAIGTKWTANRKNMIIEDMQIWNGVTSV